MLKVVPQAKKQRSVGPRSNPAPAHSQPLRFISPTLGLGLLGGLLLWAAFPPLNLPWLAWIAPPPWLWLARQPKLPGWRPYFVLWFCGTVHWLLMLEGIPLAH